MVSAWGSSERLSSTTLTKDKRMAPDAPASRGHRGFPGWRLGTSHAPTASKSMASTMLATKALRRFK